MRDKRTKRVIAEVESFEKGDEGIDFSVTDKRTITLTFPNAVYTLTGSGLRPFNKTLTPDEARAIGRELIDAADRVTSAEHVA